MKIGIIAAMPEELVYLIQQLENAQVLSFQLLSNLLGNPYVY